jgi:hypothetical protein
MNLDFTKVSYDGDLSDFSEDELKELIEEFESAQDSNVAEFETAAEALDEVDSSNIEDFEEARATLIEDVVGAEAFDEVPVTEETLEDEEATSFSDLQDWKEFVAQEEDSEDSDATFEDMGTKSPVDGEGADFVDEALGDMPGLNLDD